MNKGLVSAAVLVCGLLGGVLTRADGSDGGLKLDLEHHVVTWGDGRHSAWAASGGQTVLSVEAPPVRGLYPGAVKPLAIVISNVGRFDVRITEVSGRVTGTSRAGCKPTVQNLAVRRWESPSKLVVKAHEHKAMGTLPLYMPNTVANECQGTAFTITLLASGSQVGR
ncbi:hypothetical protein [Dactylosporangium matsuzakiense]|uniref:Uncharacterized protein n=1 Tax=Dactylosporangium matsuzakiense TaxID=53360 RepID=A0A9W6NNW1_9ACTN|nr:hypothetical protein [Dactylosporangium matsuzakiense]UWZ44856.1 hypothetical protein Dmats_47395 [Dactylosporangium matsuzakiense]GLL03671.1 hypothetical protein GCM10017581_054170 [Dactylosporangium matsuzakiense]